MKRELNALSTYQLSIFGDSVLVIDWLKMKKSSKNILMKTLYEELIRLGSLFHDTTYHHIYKEINMLADQLSNMGVQVGEGT